MKQKASPRQMTNSKSTNIKKETNKQTKKKSICTRIHTQTKPKKKSEKWKKIEEIDPASKGKQKWYQPLKNKTN